jgi:preprotein translocase subunit SecA
VNKKWREYCDCERGLGIASLFFIQSDEKAWAPCIVNAINAKELFNKDVEYSVLTDDKGKKVGVGIIDAFTGRVLDGRRWSDGLHQSVEAREGIEVSEQSQVIAKVTYQVSIRKLKKYIDSKQFLTYFHPYLLADAFSCQALFRQFI